MGGGGRGGWRLWCLGRRLRLRGGALRADLRSTERAVLGVVWDRLSTLWAAHRWVSFPGLQGLTASGAEARATHGLAAAGLAEANLWRFHRGLRDRRSTLRAHVPARLYACTAMMAEALLRRGGLRSTRRRRRRTDDVRPAASSGLAPQLDRAPGSSGCDLRQTSCGTLRGPADVPGPQAPPAGPMTRTANSLESSRPIPPI